MSEFGSCFFGRAEASQQSGKSEILTHAVGVKGPHFLMLHLQILRAEN